MLQQFYPSVHHNYKFELNKDMHFAAAHFIPHKDAGKCQDMHGHTYFINITIAGNELDEKGFLVNFGDLKKLIHGRYDHTLLNFHNEFTQGPSNDSGEFPSTEVLAETIYKRVVGYLREQSNNPKCVQIIVRETPTSYVVYRPRV